MMEKENKFGPDVFMEKVDNDDETPLDPLKLRNYEKQKLKYHFAIVECDSYNTAYALYTNVDGQELETSFSLLDIRFVPLETSFEGRKIKEECSGADGEYKPNLLQTNNTLTVMSSKKLDLDWDKTDPKRLKVTTKRNMNMNEIREQDFQDYLASYSSEESNEDVDVNKYKALLSDGKGEEEEDGPKEMEVTFQVGLADKAQDLIKKKKDGENLFVDNLKRNPKKKNENDDELDHYDTKNNNKKGKKHKKDDTPQMTQKQKDTLDLVLMDPSKKEKIQENENTKRKKKK